MKRELPKETYKRIFKRDLQNRSTKKTYKKDLQKRPTDNLDMGDSAEHQ